VETPAPAPTPAEITPPAETPPWEEQVAQEQPAPDDIIEIVDMPGIDIDAIKAQFRGYERGDDSGGATNAGADDDTIVGRMTTTATAAMKLPALKLIRS